MKDSENLTKAVESLGGEFELIRELGRGATAVVYLLRDHALDRDLAMKVIRTTLGGDEEALARLQREARLVAQLMHPNIVKLYGTHRLPDGSLALLMEHVPGRNLKEVLREEGPLSIPRTMSVLKDVASALAYAHRRRIVHRDVKPENIYIDEEVGAARLADFGVARPWDQDARLTLPGASLGTPAYMSPEQIDGKEVDGRTDVYSLGLVGYEMILGHHPWEGENVFTIIFKQKNEELPIETLGLVDAPVLARTLERALAKNPEARPESAMAFLEELSEETFTEGQDYPTERSETHPPPTPPSEPGSIPVSVGAQGSETSEETLLPVDWSVVEGPPTGPSGTDLDSPDDSQVGSYISSHAQLDARPKRRWWPILAASILILGAGSFGVYRWLPATPPGMVLRDGEPDPFAPPAEVARENPPTGGNGNEAAGLVVDAETPLEGPAGSAIQLKAHARGDGGVPLADTLILLQVEEGEGALDAAEVRTGPEGEWEVGVLLSDTPGVTLVHAQVSGSEELEFRAEIVARPGSPQKVVPLIGDRQTAPPNEPLPELLGVRVVDQLGNPIPDLDVRFEVLQGDGIVTPELTRTDDVGRAFTRWTLGTTEGPQWASAVVPEVAEAFFTFQATARAAVQPEPSQPEAPVTEAESPRAAPVVVVARTFVMGGSFVCYLAGGRPTCRGAGDRGQGGGGSLGGLVGIAAGIAHGCGLNEEGQAFCWGANESGQLGDGSVRDNRSGTEVDTEVRFSVLAAGLSHTCGLGAEGVAYCWGRNVDGQLGDGSRTDHLQPRAVGGGQTFLDLVSGWNHNCGLVSGNRAYCWGSNSEGQLGDGFRVDRLVPTRVPGNFQALAAGANHTCGIRGEEVFCWGDNAFGQLGDGTTEDRLSPVRVTGLPAPPIVLAAGAVHTCALLSDRSAFCWGLNQSGQLGDGTSENRSTPVSVAGGLDFITLSAGGGSTCGFVSDGSEYCWGLNQSGQLGDGSRTNRSSPVRVGGEDR